MKSKFASVEKQVIVSQYWVGQSVASLCADHSIPRSTLYSWLKPYKSLKSSERAQSGITQKEYADLKRHAEKQEQILQIMKASMCLPNAPLVIRLSAFCKLQGQFSARVLCEALNISRGTYYNRVLHKITPTISMPLFALVEVS